MPVPSADDDVRSAPVPLTGRLTVAGAPVRLAYNEVDRARTVFEWGPAPRPRAPRHPADQKGAPTAGKKKRKQVASR